jgi:GGDEF domain-containing protein
MPKKSGHFQMDETGIIGYVIFSDNSISKPFLTKSKGVEIVQLFVGIGLNGQQAEYICQQIRNSDLIEEDEYLDEVSESFAIQLFEQQKHIEHLSKKIDGEDGEKWKES